jgi:hypothetical protein
VGRDEAHARNVMARIVAEVSAQSYPGEEKLQQEKMRFTWGASQYDREGDKTLDGFISEVLLDTRPDRT